MTHQKTYIRAAAFYILCLLPSPAFSQDHAVSLKNAIEEGSLAIVKELMQQGVNPNQRWTSGATPLHIATAEEDPAIAKTLINAGADVNAKDDFNATPLGEATEFGNIKIIYILAKNNALLNEGAQPSLDVNFNPDEVYIPLHQAAKNKDVNAIQALLNVGADPNAKDNQKETALHHATENGQIDIVRMLLYAGADPSATSATGKTPLNIATKIGYPEIVQTLIDNGARITKKDKKIAQIQGNKNIRKQFDDYFEREYLFDKLKRGDYAQQDQPGSQLGTLPPEMIETITDYVRTPKSKK
jgi:ankyrin repeat protein